MIFIIYTRVIDVGLYAGMELSPFFSTSKSWSCTNSWFFLPFATHKNEVLPTANNHLERSDVESVFGNKGNKKADQGFSLVSPCSKIAAALQKMYAKDNPSEWNPIETYKISCRKALWHKRRTQKIGTFTMQRYPNNIVLTEKHSWKISLFHYTIL